MKTQTFFSILTAIVLALLLLSGTGAYWLATNRVTLEGAVGSNPAASVFIARQSPWVMSLLVNPDRLTDLQLQDTPPQQRRQVQRKWQKLQQALFASSQLDYNQDIRPWLGDELTFAVTTADFDRDEQNGQQPGYLLVATVKDAEQAQQSLQDYWQKRTRAGEALVLEQYAGVPLGYTTKKNRGKPDKQGASADRLPPLTSPAIATVSDQFVLFANHPKILRDAINNLQVPELSLSTSETYQAALEQLNSSHIGVLFAQLPQLTSWLQETGQASLMADLASATTTASTVTPTFESLVMGFNVGARGLLGDMLLFPASNDSLLSGQPGLATPVQALQYIPVESNWVAAGKDLTRLLTQVNDRVTEDSPLKQLLDQPFDRLQEQFPLNLAEAVLPWLTGEYAVATLSGVDQSHPDWMLVAERSPETEAGVAQLDTLAQEQGMTLASFTLDDQPVATWTKLSTTGTGTSQGRRSSISVQVDVKAAHTTLGNYEILATSLDAIKQAIGAAQHPLLTDAPFQTAVQALPSPNRGYLYFNHPALGTVWANQFGKKTAVSMPLLDLQPLLDQVQSIAVSSSSEKSIAQHSQVFLQLADDT